MDQLVSIIIPTFGRSFTLKRAIDSVLLQTYKNFEIIIVDDNNPNTEGRIETEKIISEYKDNPLINYLQHKENKNGAAARNTGIDNSKGDYICFLDDDDSFLPEKLEKQVYFLEKNKEFDAVYCGYYKGNKQNHYKMIGNLTKELLLMMYEPVTSTLMFSRKSILKINGFNENFKRHQDYELMLRFFEHYKVGFVDDFLVDIGLNDGENILHGKELENLKEYYFKQFQDIVNIIDEKEKGFKSKLYVKHYSKVCLNHINHGYYLMGGKLLAKHFVKNPLLFSNQIIKDTVSYFYKKHISKEKYEVR